MLGPAAIFKSETATGGRSEVPRVWRHTESDAVSPLPALGRSASQHGPGVQGTDRPGGRSVFPVRKINHRAPQEPALAATQSSVAQINEE